MHLPGIPAYCWVRTFTSKSDYALAKTLFEINPELDRELLAKTFAERGRVQIADVLTSSSAQEVHSLLTQGTPWELAWQAGAQGEAQTVPHEVLRSAQAGRAAALVTQATDEAARRGDYAFRFASYPMLRGYLEQRMPGGPHDILLEHLNTPETLDLVREISGIAQLCKADAQATLFSGNNYLGHHTDSHKEEGWRLAYVLGFAPPEWHADWGGYLVFYDENEDIVEGWRPRFNVLNLFAVPTSHAVTYVPPFAPNGRVSVTGWFRDR